MKIRLSASAFTNSETQSSVIDSNNQHCLTSAGLASLLDQLSTGLITETEFLMTVQQSPIQNLMLDSFIVTSEAFKFPNSKRSLDEFNQFKIARFDSN